MKASDITGKTFTYNNTKHIAKEIRKIDNDGKDMILVYSDTLFPVNYDIVFFEDVGEIINIEF